MSIQKIELFIAEYEAWSKKHPFVFRSEVAVIRKVIPKSYQSFQSIQQDHDVSSIPFIFLTAYSEKKDVEEALSMGVQDYIVKPFDADDLVALVRKYLPELIQGQ